MDRAGALVRFLKDYTIFRLPPPAIGRAVSEQQNTGKGTAMVRVRVSLLSLTLAALALTGLKADAWEASRPVGPFPKLKSVQAPSGRPEAVAAITSAQQGSLKALLEQTTEGSTNGAFGRRTVPYPYSDGVSLGQGWDFVTNTQRMSSCIDFKTGQDLYQNASLQMNEAIDIDSLDVSLNVALGGEAHGSFLGFKAGAETKSTFDTKFHTKSTDQVLVAQASVVNGATFVTPVAPARSAQGAPPPVIPAPPVPIKPLPNNPTGAGAPPEVKAPQDEIRPGKAAVSGEYSEKNLRLAPEMSKLAKTNPTRFREVCGDGFVASIVSGADLYVMYHFRDIERSMMVKLGYFAKANAGYGSLFDATGSSDFKAQLDKASSSSQLSIHIVQTGGRIAELPVDHAGVERRIKALTTEALTGPRPLYMVVVPYSTLMNWEPPALNHLGTMREHLIQYQKRLTSVYFEYLNIRADDKNVSDIVTPDQKVQYLFERRHGLRIEEEEYDLIGDLVLAEIKEIDVVLDKLDTCALPVTSGEPEVSERPGRRAEAYEAKQAVQAQQSGKKCQESKFSKPTQVDFDDYKYWIRLPVPINAVPTELLARLDAKDIGEDQRRVDYKNLLYSHWVERISDFRCRLFFECMAQTERQEKKKMIELTFDPIRYRDRRLEEPKKPN